MSLDGLGLSLFGKFGLEGLLTLGDIALVACWVDEGVGVAGLFAGEFAEEVEVAAVGSEEDVAGQGLEGLELTGVIGGHLRVLGVIDEVLAWIDVGAADNDGVVTLAAIFQDCGPGGAAFGVARSFMGGEGSVTEGDRFAVVEDAADFGGRIKELCALAKEEIGFAAGLDYGNISIHGHVFGAGFAQNLGTAGAVVVVGMADE